MLRLVGEKAFIKVVGGVVTNGDDERRPKGTNNDDERGERCDCWIRLRWTMGGV